MIIASHNVVYGLHLTNWERKVRQAYAHLIQSGTCQRHTTCSWPQRPDPPLSDTCQAYTMCSCPRRSDLISDRVNLDACAGVPQTDRNMSNAITTWLVWATPIKIQIIMSATADCAFHCSCNGHSLSSGSVETISGFCFSNSANST
jgi:hypothetical protein